jgi:hypothetical protein
VTTSAGRLFPGVSSLGFRLHVYNFLLQRDFGQVLCTVSSEIPKVKPLSIKLIVLPVKHHYWLLNSVLFEALFNSMVAIKDEDT